MPIPFVEEDLLFQCQVDYVNNDGNTAVIEYAQKCIEEEDPTLQNYPDVTDYDCIITNYKLSMFKDDHE